MRVETLEALADTIVPGPKRGPGDRAVAGMSPTGGAVAAGALELLEWDATGVSGGLDDYARSLNEHARAYAGQRGIVLEEGVPAFVALPFEERGALVRILTAPGHPEKALWVLLVLFCYMAYDSAAHTSTADAIKAGHPGLTAMGVARPDADGLWRFPAFSYGRPLADPHPHTTASGSPA
ncbi:MAG: regulator [Nonomuraea sp.]|nr:regulator [Nonomuraea sp.]NUS07364.1 regulator [Nonomuraea sp.]NUT42007.1 regulator [Thermoactinospora sp.]